MITNKIDKQKLKKVLANHRKWLFNPKKGKQANLQHANLQGTDLHGADLQHVNLQDANLQVVNLRYVNLQDANLQGVDLRYANLRGADLQHADLHGADLQHVDLQGANLQDANLRYADLQDANLQGTDLRYANLQDANLQGTKNIDKSKQNYTTIGIVPTCPETGSFIAWKKVNNILIKLQIPVKAKRSSATSRKCRADHAKVIKVYNTEGKLVNYTWGCAIYEDGKIVHCHSWDEDRWNECSGGIHFFMNKHDAETY